MMVVVASPCDHIQSLLSWLHSECGFCVSHMCLICFFRNSIFLIFRKPYCQGFISFSVHSRFMRTFTEKIGVSPKQYLLRIKFEHAIELLSNIVLYVAQISKLVGISDSNYFSCILKKHTGHPPGFYR